METRHEVVPLNWRMVQSDTQVNASTQQSAIDRITFTAYRQDGFNQLVVTNTSALQIGVRLNGDTTREYLIPPQNTFVLEPPEDLIWFSWVTIRNVSTTTTLAAGLVSLNASLMRSN